MSQLDISFKCSKCGATVDGFCYNNTIRCWCGATLEIPQKIYLEEIIEINTKQ
jgi:hypothetical protein